MMASFYFSLPALQVINPTMLKAYLARPESTLEPGCLVLHWSVSTVGAHQQFVAWQTAMLLVRQVAMRHLLQAA